MQVKYLSLLLLLSTSIPCWGSAIELHPSCHTEPGEVTIYFDDGGFIIGSQGSNTRLEKHQLDTRLRNINGDQLKSFLAVGYLRIKHMNDGTRELESKIRGPGGLPAASAAGVALFNAVWYGIPLICLADEVKDGIKGARNLWNDMKEEEYQYMVKSHEMRQLATMEEIVKARPYMNLIKPKYAPANDDGWHLDAEGKKVWGHPASVAFNALSLNFPKSGEVLPEAFTYKPETHITNWTLADVAHPPIPVNNTPIEQTLRTNFDANNMHARRALFISSYADSHNSGLMQASPMQKATNGRMILKSVSFAAGIYEDVIEPAFDQRKYFVPMDMAESFVHGVISTAVKSGGMTPKEVLVSGLAASIANGSYFAMGSYLSAKIGTVLMFFPYF